MLHHELDELQHIHQSGFYLRGTVKSVKCFCTVTDLRQIKLGEVPPLQAVSGVCDVAGDCRLAVPDRCTWEDRHVGFRPQETIFTSFVCFYLRHTVYFHLGS